MFEDSTFETNGTIRTRSRNWMLATFAFNGSVLLALVVFPLILPQALPRPTMPNLVDMLLPPHGPQQQPRQPAHAAPAAPTALPNPFAAPRVIPVSISTDSGPVELRAFQFLALTWVPPFPVASGPQLPAPTCRPSSVRSPQVRCASPRESWKAYYFSRRLLHIRCLQRRPGLKVPWCLRPSSPRPAPSRIFTWSAVRPCSGRQRLMPSGPGATGPIFSMASPLKLRPRST